MARKITFDTPKRPIAEGVVIGLLAIIVLELLTYFIYHYAYEAQKGEIFEGLNRTANVAQTVLDKDAHHRWRSVEQECDLDFIAQNEKLLAILQSDSTIEFIYTLIKDEDDTLRFILDPTPPGDANNDGVEDAVLLMDPWLDPSADALNTFATQERTISKEVYFDEWGGHIGCYVPIFSSDGKFETVLGINISAVHYFERLRPIEEATVRAMMAILFIGFLFGTSIWFLRKFQKIIAHV